MAEQVLSRGTRPSWFWIAGSLFLAASGSVAILAGCSRNGAGTAENGPPPAFPASSGDSPQRIKVFCGNCHEYPPADVFPRSAWKTNIERMYMFFGQSGRPLQPPPIEDVVRFYEERAPLELPPAEIRRDDHPLPVRFQRIEYPAFAGPPTVSPPHISHVNLVHLFDPKRLDVLACDMQGGAVLVLQPYLPEAKWRLLYGTGTDKGFNPAHTEVVDLDQDGIADILVANLGSFLPTDRRCGSVVWLRGLGDGRFEPVTLLKDRGRVADVQVRDFNGDGKLDLVVASFGWNTIGEIYYLENQTTDWKKPRFTINLVDERHGAIHVPIADLNGDGKPDFIALIAQEHETIVAFLNEGGGRFRKETLYKAPHPGYGSSGIQLVDLNGDGKLDVLYTNGDVLDQPYLLKPYHSVQWLENTGNLTFKHHPLTPMYGVHRAVAADLDGDGDLDIVAVSFLPKESFREREAKKLDAVIVLEQTAPGVFARHGLETGTCDYVSCASGDVFGSGKQDVVVGDFRSHLGGPAISIWKNLGGGLGRAERDNAPLSPHRGVDAPRSPLAARAR
jgi:hypothetical protein